MNQTCFRITYFLLRTGCGFRTRAPNASKYLIHKCSLCPGDTSFFCEPCRRDLCQLCKVKHVQDLETKDHNVMTYCEKKNCTSKQEICSIHTYIYGIYCESCERPICSYCTDHRKHQLVNIKTAYQTKRQQIRRTINIIRSDALLYSSILLEEKKEIIQSCNVQIKNRLLQMQLKAKNLLDVVVKDVYDIGIIHRCTTDMQKIKKHNDYLERFVNKYEQSAITPIKFLLLIQKSRLLYIRDCPCIKKHAKLQSESPSKKNERTSLLKENQPTISNAHIGYERLLKLMPTIELYQYFTVPDCKHCYHISCVSSDLVWVSVDEHKLILINKAGVQKQLEDSHMGFCFGTHAVNSQGEMIYFDKQECIRKLSQDMKTTAIIEQPQSFDLGCLYLSPSTGDLFVMIHEDSRRKKLVRYNHTGELTQTIPLDQYEMSCNFVTENINSDIVLSFFNNEGYVVITDCKGRRRFSYTRHPSGSELWPRGICTDALSNILVCDIRSNSVHLIDKNGMFLSHLLIRPPGVFIPHSLSYDMKTHHLWVGSQEKNKVFVYKYISQRNLLAGMFDLSKNIIMNELSRMYS